MQILIIDDDDSIRDVFQRVLKNKGYEVCCASDGKEGLLLFDAEQPDLVITDIIMPDMDGLEVIMSIRSKSADTPIVAISGGTPAMPIDFLPMAEKFGASKVLYKPIEIEQLVNAIQEAALKKSA